MARFFLTIISSVFLLSIFSCNSHNKQLQKEYSIFLNKEIKIPAFLKGVYKNRDTVYFQNDEVMARMVVFFDSTTCGSCQIARVWEWERITSHVKATGSKFEPIFIFAPPKQQESETILYLKAQSFNWPMFVDAQQSFLANNVDFPKNKLFHVFLLDKNNKVVLVGDPTYNSELWELYKTTIAQLIENEGVMPIVENRIISDVII